MNLLVTGGSGFIGTYLVRSLLAKGHNLRILSRGRLPLRQEPCANFNWHRCDICDQDSLGNLFSRIGKIDAVLHLAACIDYQGSRDELFKINASATNSILELSAKHGAKRFVFASSIEAVGPLRLGRVPADEMTQCRPVNDYGISKLQAERFVGDFGSREGMSTVILRIGNVYGPGSLSFILPIYRALVDKEWKWLNLYRNTFLWHPVYAQDVSDGIMRALSLDSARGIYILSGSHSPTVGKLAQIISGEIKVRIPGLSWGQRLYYGLRSFLLNRRQVHYAYSIEKAKRELGYLPVVGLKEGIARTIAWGREQGLLK